MCSVLLARHINDMVMKLALVTYLPTYLPYKCSQFRGCIECGNPCSNIAHYHLICDHIEEAHTIVGHLASRLFVASPSLPACYYCNPFHP